jgi:hypothetical protein
MMPEEWDGTGGIPGDAFFDNLKLRPATRWRSHGPGGGWVVSPTIDPQRPSVIWAGTQVGTFMSLDGGDSWNSVESGPKDLYVGASAVSGLGSACVPSRARFGPE